MRRILTILFLFFEIVCFGQASITDFTLSLDFSPSFIIPSSLTISHKQDTNLIELKVYKNWDKKDLYINNKATLANVDVNAIMDFLKIYKFQIKGSTDTTDMHKEFIDGDSVTVYSMSTGTDGITVDGTFTQENIIKTFSFWSPRKETENHKLMELIFPLLYKSFSEAKALNYIEQLEGYFSFGLGLKKISNKPLKYKIYGSISSNEESEITSFIKTLPSNEDVFIDLSNFNGMGTMFYPLFKTLSKKDSKVFWVNPSEEGLRQLKEIEVPTKNILK